VLFDSFKKFFFRPAAVVEVSQSPAGILFAVQNPHFGFVVIVEAVCNYGSQ
jgi:hypothetical protein